MTKQSVGIDTSELFVARTGIRRANDLVWVGRAANHAAKLSARSGSVSQITGKCMIASVNYPGSGILNKACGVSPWRPRLEIEESIPRMECGKCRGDSARTSGPRQAELRYLGRHQVSQEGSGGLFPVLRSIETSSGLGLPDCGGGVPGDNECPERGIEVEGKFTEISVGIIVGNSGTPAYFHFDPFQLTGSTSTNVGYSGQASNYVTVARPGFHNVAVGNAQEIASRGDQRLLLVPDFVDLCLSEIKENLPQGILLCILEDSRGHISTDAILDQLSTIQAS